MRCSIISNTASTDYGGVRCEGEGRMEDCDVAYNHAGLVAGGVSVYQGELRNCRLFNNIAGTTGGGLYAREAILSNVIVTANTASNSAGMFGAYCEIFDCTISSNIVADDLYAGGAFLYGCVVHDSLISDNSGASRGGGVYIMAGTILQRCILSGNSSGTGGGVYMGTSHTGRLENCAIYANEVAQWGGGVFSETGGVLDVVNCTIAGNSADVGGGVFNARLLNSIVFSNTAVSSDSDFAGGETEARYSCLSSLPPGAADCITNSPLLADTSVGDLRLTAQSPCIDRGQPGDYSGQLDLDGRPRIFGAGVDMGCLEAAVMAIGISGPPSFSTDWSVPPNATCHLERSEDLRGAEWIRASLDMMCGSGQASISPTNTPSSSAAFRAVWTHD